MKIQTLCSVALLHLALCCTAPVELLAYDGFDYTAGDLTGKSGGSGWSGAYTESDNSTIYTTPGLAYTGLTTIGGASKTNGASGITTINFRNVGTTYGDDKLESWISFLAQRNGAASTVTFAELSFYNSTGILAANSEVPFANGGTSGAWRILDNGTSVSASIAVVPASDTPYLLVVRIRWGAGASGADAVSLYVNPSLGSPPVVADASNDVAVTNFDKVRIAGQSAVNYTFDEIRVGTSFFAATGQPEPIPPPIHLTVIRSSANYDFT